MNLIRQESLLPQGSFVHDVTIIGCGGIGSHLALQLPAMGCERLTLIDGDHVESHNIGPQRFRVSDLKSRGPEGRTAYKVHSLKEQIEGTFDHCGVTAMPEFFDGSQELSGIVISGVHSMESRVLIWDWICEHFADVPLYIDGRIGGELVQVFSIRPVYPDEAAFYKNFLFSDEMALKGECLRAEIAYVGNIISGIIGKRIAHWMHNTRERLPQLTHGSVATMMFATVFSQPGAKGGE